MYRTANSTKGIMGCVDVDVWFVLHCEIFSKTKTLYTSPQSIQHERKKNERNTSCVYVDCHTLCSPSRTNTYTHVGRFRSYGIMSNDVGLM